jgi:uncharacterized protein (TIGR02679 family)
MIAEPAGAAGGAPPGEFDAEALAYLARPGLRRLLFAARERFEQNGGPRGSVALERLSPEEAHALNGLLASPVALLAGASARVKLARLDQCLRASRFSVSLEQALIALDGPLVNRPRQRAAARATRLAAWARVLAHPQAARPELEPWLEYVRQRFGGSVPERAAIVLQALDVLAALPADGIPLAALAAARAGGDAHALDRNRPLGRLLPPALAALEGSFPREPSSVEEWRALWERFGVSCDELSCTALVLGLRPHRLARGYLAGRLRAAASHGRPLVVTLAELRSEPPRLSGETLFVCENPSILAAAAKALGARCPPLLCTGGWPNTAVAAVLHAAEKAGMRILVHADGDAAGAEITARVLRRRRACRWREPPSQSPPVHEEAILQDLLGDLAAAAS